MAALRLSDWLHYDATGDDVFETLNGPIFIANCSGDYPAFFIDHDGEWAVLPKAERCHSRYIRIPLLDAPLSLPEAVGKLLRLYVSLTMRRSKHELRGEPVYQLWSYTFGKRHGLACAVPDPTVLQPYMVLSGDLNNL